MKNNFRIIQKKWQEKWEKSKILEAIPNKNKKFFVNICYPYLNGYGHIGHLFTFLRGDITARFNRMRGYNVLFPQAFHATGQPIVAAAKRVKNKEKKQIRILSDMGFSKKEIEKFSDPIQWITLFSKKWKKDFKDLGFSIDWNRSFITTSLNKPYDTFIKWQFNKLKQKNLIRKGEHPVVYCNKCNFPIGDHDRLEGEGITPEKVILLKFEFMSNKEKIKIPVMTYRPETIYGVTNLWINPINDYIIIEISKKDLKEKWLIEKNMINALKNQGFEIRELNTIKNEDIIGKMAINPVTNTKIIILPADFVDANIGSGIVMSVPAHAPFDYAAIKELRENDNLRKKYNINEKEIDFDFISLIEIDGYNEFPAVEAVEKEKIKLQKEKLEKLTQEIYKKEFHSGIIKIPEFIGKKVYEIKDELIDTFIAKKIGTEYFILQDKVICRCLNIAIVKIVKNQWFLCYNEKEWKIKAHSLVDKMNFYPKTIKNDLHYTIDWLNDWACSRNKRTSIGTTLPFDETQIIESLSDSTIYTAYYTIAKYLQNGEMKSDKIVDENLFEFVFLGKGNSKNVSEKNGIEIKDLENMRNEFLYWYKNGFDIRISGKDLIQNHLTFCIFNHVAIFEKENLPSGMSINGHILLNKEKMGKSKGNVILIKDAIQKYHADVIRFLIAYSGDSGIDDANIEINQSEKIEKKLYSFYELCISKYNTGSSKYRTIDRWFECAINKTLEKVEKNYDEINTKSVIQNGFFELQNHFKWYNNISTGLNKEIFKKFIEIQTKILAPIVPHICEEIWEKIGKTEFISLSEWPKVENNKINKKIIELEEIFKKTISDINYIINVNKGKCLFIYIETNDEFDIFDERIKYIKNMFKFDNVELFKTSDKEKFDPKNKSQKTKYGKPGIYIE